MGLRGYTFHGHVIMVDSVKQVEYVLNVIAVSFDDTADLLNLTFEAWLGG